MLKLCTGCWRWRDEKHVNQNDQCTRCTHGHKIPFFNPPVKK